MTTTMVNLMGMIDFFFFKDTSGHRGAVRQPENDDARHCMLQ